MYVLLKDDLVIESSHSPIVAATDGDYFVSQTRHHYDPRPSSGVVVVEMEFPKESFCEYRMVNGIPALINPPIPQSVTMRQARLALLGAGLLDTVETAITGAGPAAKIEWDYATEVQRSAGLVPAMATALGMTDAQIDVLFIAAAAL